MAFDPLNDFLQGSLGVPVIVADQRAADDRVLPDIVMVYFGHRDIELAVQARQQRFEPVAFLFQRRAAGNVNMESEQAEGHGASGGW